MVLIYSENLRIEINIPIISNFNTFNMCFFM